MKNKKIIVYEEVAYIVANVILSFAVAMVTAADFGVSMIVAPAYIVSLKFPVLSFGQAEYVVQAFVFATLCIIKRKIKPIYFFSFFTCVFYGFILDVFRKIIPIFNPDVIPHGSFDMWLRVVFYVFGLLITSFSVALFMKIYLYSQVYDFFVKIISEHFGIKLSKFKTGFDISCLVVAIALSLLFFGTIKGIGIGTVIMAFINGSVIGFFAKIFDKYIDFKPIFKKTADAFNK